MNDPRLKHEPSMEEILASIRKIISEEDGDGAPARHDAVAQNASANSYAPDHQGGISYDGRPHNGSGYAHAPEPDDPLDLTEMVAEDGSVVRLDEDEVPYAGHEEPNQQDYYPEAAADPALGGGDAAYSYAGADTLYQSSDDTVAPAAQDQDTQAVTADRPSVRAENRTISVGLSPDTPIAAAPQRSGNAPTRRVSATVERETDPEADRRTQRLNQTQTVRKPPPRKSDQDDDLEEAAVPQRVRARAEKPPAKRPRSNVFAELAGNAGDDEEDDGIDYGKAAERGRDGDEDDGARVVLEDIVRQMVQPMLQKWLDNNLPNLVEEMVGPELIEEVVRKELRKMIERRGGL
jgi:cell pole-organizing protein PopZ